jgi:hypothetical protein
MSTIAFSVTCAIFTSQEPVSAHPEKSSYLEAGNPGVLCDGNIFPGETNEAIDYQKKMALSFHRNLGNLSIRKSVTIQLFLSSDGFIRNLQVIKAGANKIETMECVDAVLSSSPLPPPPSFRRPLPPAPYSEILPANWYGSGLYQYTFPGAGKISSATAFKLRRIPLEVAYRYPNLFSLSELEAPSNSITVKDPTCQLLEDLRLQWAIFFSKYPSASKAQVENWSLRVIERFLGEKTREQ